MLGAGTVTQQRQGDPLFSQWYRNYTYADKNGDGIIQLNEVQVTRRCRATGVGFAKDIASVQSGFDLFQRKLRINTLFDYKGGGNTLEGNYFQCSSAPRACQETQDPTAPLWMQARAVAVTYGTKVNGTTYTTRNGYFVQAQYWKFREVSAVITLPNRINRMLASQIGSTFVIRRAQHPHLDELHRRGSRAELRRDVDGDRKRLQHQPAADLLHFPSQPEVLTQTEDDTMMTQMNRARWTIAACV